MKTLKEKLPEAFFYKGKNFTFKWDPKEKLSSVNLTGDQAREDAEEFRQKIIDFLNTFPESYWPDIFLDCSGAKKITHEARRVYAKISRVVPGRPRLAIIGLNTILRVVLGFIMNTAGRTEMKFFEKKEEALEWLRHKNK